MKHSIIVTVYNKEKYIKESLESLINQKRLPYEIIIVDDNSSDNSLDIIKNFKNKYESSIKIKLICNKENKGPGEARNIGLRKVSGDYLSFLDADDQYYNNYVLKVNEAHKKTKFDMLIVKINSNYKSYIKPKINVLENFLIEIKDEIYLINNPIKACTYESLFAGGGNVIIKTKLAENIFFDKECRIFEDWDFYFRIINKNKNIKVYFLNKILEEYNDTTENSLSEEKVNNINDISFPILLERLKNKNTSTLIKYRKKITMCWLYNSLSRLNIVNRYKYVWKYRNLFKDNILFDKYFISSIIILLFGKRIPYIIYKKLK